jgi:hypothetical protein
MVTDAASRQALPDVLVTVVNSNPAVETNTDASGNFLLSGLPVGRYAVQCRLAGYEPAVFREIMVSSGKEVFVEIVMRENVHDRNERMHRPRTNKETPLHQMVTGSVRTLSVEEASRYAGGFDDPARWASTFAGVSGGTSRNDISIRGNSPQSLQWRIEGVEAVNPTHFSDISGVGEGVVTALSAHVLGSSDFFTGAFPAEYGNALSGVFDMQLRNGNSQNYEHTVQVGTLGVELASEGPFSKAKQASYLFSYRYQSLDFLGNLFPDMIGEAAGMRFQNLSFKMNFPTRQAGTFSVWGVGGDGHFRQRTLNDTAKWRNAFRNEADYRQDKATGGLGHLISIGEKAYLKSALAVNYTQNRVAMEQRYTDRMMRIYTGNRSLPVADMKSENWGAAFNTFLNTKFGAAHTNRTGFNIMGLFFDLDYFMCADIWRVPPGEMINFVRGRGNSVLYSAFSQSSFRLNSRLTANAGLTGMYFRLNGKATVEPRAGIRWQAFTKHAFGFAYGKHSSRESLDYYFVENSPEEGAHPNKKLDFSKAHHFVFSYDWAISEHLILKVEPYYQYLYDIPVAENSRASLINQRDFHMMTSLVNAGKGKNYGIDATLEHHLHDGYYFLLTASVFDSRSKEGAGDWQNTRLNRNFVFNALAGKEWKTGRQKQNILSVSIRSTLQGGERFIPIDGDKSKASKSIVYDREKAYRERLPAEFINHLTLGYKINRAKSSHEISLKVINLTANKELKEHTYNYHTDQTEMYMSAGVIPNVSYKVDF